MADEPRLLASDEVIVREEGDAGEALVFVPETERIKVLNRAGLWLWTWCDGGHTRQDLVTRLAEKYPAVDRDVLKANVDDFVQDLQDLGLVSELSDD